MIGYKLHCCCFGDMLQIAIFYAELIREEEDSAAARAPVLAKLDGCQR